MSLAASSRARNKIRQWFSRETREETEHKGRETLETALKKQNLPYKKLQGSAVLAQVIRESGFKKAEDFYLALGSGKLQPGQIVNKVIQRLKTEQVAEEEAVPLKAPKARHAVSSENFGIMVRGVDDVLVRLAKCCTPLPGDKIVGYVSMGKGITIHREDCSNVKALKRNPERFTKVSWDGGATQSFRVQISVDSWDRPRLLEDVARTFAEHGANIVEYGGHVEDQLAKNWYVAEVGDVKALRSLLTALRNVDAVFDAYRVTPPRRQKANPSNEGSSLERAGYLERGMALFASADYNVRRGEGHLARGCGARSFRGQRAGARRARPVAAVRARRAPRLSGMENTRGGLPPSFARGTSAQKRPWTTGSTATTRPLATTATERPARAPLTWTSRAREVDRVELADAVALPRSE